MDLENCPWKSSRWSPSKQEMSLLLDYMTAKTPVIDSMLEIGCGVSTWYMSQLNFKEYVAVESYGDAVDNVRHHLPSVLLLDNWKNIPKRQYQYIFIDSHVGGEDKNLNGCRRDAPLTYIMENNLYCKDSILIAHDYNKIKKYRNDCISKNGKRWSWWNMAVDKYGWVIDHEIEFKRSFGVYVLKCGS